MLPPFHSNAEGLHEVGFQLRVLMQELAEVASPHTLAPPAASRKAGKRSKRIRTPL